MSEHFMFEYDIRVYRESLDEMFSAIPVVLDENAIMPKRAHEGDVGYDLFAREDGVVFAHDSCEFDTGVHIKLPEISYNSGGPYLSSFKTAGLVLSKSGLNFKHDLLSDGVIDPNYRGSIRVKLYNHGDHDYQVRRGDKISQLVIVPVITFGLREVDALDETDRGEGGFGSTGR